MRGQETVIEMLHALGIYGSDALRIMRHPVRGARLAQSMYLAWKNDICRDPSEPHTMGLKLDPDPVRSREYGYAVNPELVPSYLGTTCVVVSENEFKLPKHDSWTPLWPKTEAIFAGSAFIIKRDADGLCRQTIKLERFNLIKNSTVIIPTRLIRKMYTEAARASLADLNAHYEKYLDQVLHTISVIEKTRAHLEETGTCPYQDNEDIYRGFGTETVGGLRGEVNRKGEIKVTGVHTFLDCGVALDNFKQREHEHSYIARAIKADPKYFRQEGLIGIYHSHPGPLCPGFSYRDKEICDIYNDITKRQLFNINAVLDLGFLSSKFPELVRDEIKKASKKLDTVEEIAAALKKGTEQKKIRRHLLGSKELFLRQLKTHFRRTLTSRLMHDCVEFAITNRHLFSPVYEDDLTSQETRRKNAVHGIVEIVKIV